MANEENISLESLAQQVNDISDKVATHCNTLIGLSSTTEEIQKTLAESGNLSENYYDKKTVDDTFLTKEAAEAYATDSKVDRLFESLDDHVRSIDDTLETVTTTYLKKSEANSLLSAEDADELYVKQADYDLEKSDHLTEVSNLVDTKLTEFQENDLEQFKTEFEGRISKTYAQRDEILYIHKCHAALMERDNLLETDIDEIDEVLDNISVVLGLNADGTTTSGSSTSLPAQIDNINSVLEKVTDTLGLEADGSPSEGQSGGTLKEQIINEIKGNGPDGPDSLTLSGLDTRLVEVEGQISGNGEGETLSSRIATLEYATGVKEAEGEPQGPTVVTRLGKIEGLLGLDQGGQATPGAPPTLPDRVGKIEGILGLSGDPGPNTPTVTTRLGALESRLEMQAGASTAVNNSIPDQLDALNNTLNGKLNALNAALGFTATNTGGNNLVDWGNSGNTTQAVGGIAKGTNLKDKTVYEILDMILYTKVGPTIKSITTDPSAATCYDRTEYTEAAVSTITVNIENGSSSLSKIELYVGDRLVGDSNNSAIMSLSSNWERGGSVTITLRTTLKVGHQTELKVKAIDENSLSSESSKNVFYFVNPYYYGTCAADTIIASANLKSLGLTTLPKNLHTTCAVTYENVNNECMVFAYPTNSDRELTSIKPDGMADSKDSFSVSTISLNNTQYKVYKAKNPSTLSNYKVTFTF